MERIRKQKEGADQTFSKAFKDGQVQALQGISMMGNPKGSAAAVSVAESLRDPEQAVRQQALQGVGALDEVAREANALVELDLHRVFQAGVAQMHDLGLGLEDHLAAGLRDAAGGILLPIARLRA